MDATETSFNSTAVGSGSFTGLSYTVPAHASGTISAEIQTQSLTSDNVDTLNKLISGMLSASAQEKVEEHRKISASADLSFFDFFCGGASASFEQTNDTMRSLGLTTDQITTIVNAMAEAASKMSTVKLDFTIDNTDNDYSVSGDLQLFTMSGEINTAAGRTEYRMLANDGTAGSDGSAPAHGKIIPLN